MYGGDRIPDLMPTKHFPLGDITDAYKEKRTNEWMDRIAKMDHKQFGTYLQTNHKPSTLIEKTAPYKNYYGGLDLCREWDKTHKSGKRYAVTGYMVALAFNEGTHYLPVPNVDLSPDLKLMAEPIEDVDRVRLFGQTAWRSVLQYPNVHTTLERVYDHARSRWNLGPDENGDYFMAGFMVPFMMSVAGRLINYTPEFTGLSDQKYDLRTTEFQRLFIKDVELAPDVVLPNTADEES